VAGLRTPFAKANTALKELTSVELGVLAVRELVERTELDLTSLDLVVFGQVIPTPLCTSVAREVVLRSGLPKRVQAHTVSRACATSVQAITDAADQIALGHADVAIAGGTEAMSDPPIFASRALAHALAELQRAKTGLDKAKVLGRLSLGDLAPVPPALREPTTGLLMGDSAEKMAKENGISREAQDRFAYGSHRRATAAIEAGKLKDEVMVVRLPPDFEQVVDRDNLVRPDTTLEALAKLGPVFDRRHGTVTAGNSSPLTDGAAAVLLMSEERCRAMGIKPLGFLRSYAYAALDPGEQLLMGPAYAAPMALERAGMTLQDVTLVDMHEAFAAQCLSNLQGFASKKFAEQKLGRSAPLGEIDPERLNVNGGSIALGHPFGATGARMVTQTLRELGRRGGGTALLTLCAAGGLGAAVVVEAD
jgi:acetyl-CoA acyltransferase